MANNLLRWLHSILVVFDICNKRFSFISTASGALVVGGVRDTYML